MTVVHYREGGFPPENRMDWRMLAPLITEATAAVARYDGVLGQVPNRDILVSSLTTREAVLSSRIEGTQATLGEVLEYGAGKFSESSELNDDITEIINYKEALERSTEMLKTVPLSVRVVKEAHRVLMSGARGASKAPGEFRQTQNWIGGPGDTLETASYVPISPEKLPDAFTRWERYIHDESLEPMTQLAIMHAEFEALHPFLDCNGRLGRLLIPLFLWQRGLIRAPMFYISAYFETHRPDYYEGLLRISRDNDWTGWCRFFLEAVKQQAQDGLNRAQAIIQLYESMKERIIGLTRSQYAIYALDWIFERPVFYSNELANNKPIPRPTATRIIKVLREAGVLKTFIESSGRRPALLGFSELRRIADKDVF